MFDIAKSHDKSELNCVLQRLHSQQNYNVLSDNSTDNFKGRHTIDGDDNKRILRHKFAHDISLLLSLTKTQALNFICKNFRNDKFGQFLYDLCEPKGQKRLDQLVKQGYFNNDKNCQTQTVILSVDKKFKIEFLGSKDEPQSIQVRCGEYTDDEIKQRNGKWNHYAGPTPSRKRVNDWRMRLNSIDENSETEEIFKKIKKISTEMENELKN